MTKKDYIILAKALSEYRQSGVSSEVAIKKNIEKLLSILEPAMKKQNRNFNSDKFNEDVWNH